MIKDIFEKLAKLYHETESLNFVMEYYNFYEAYCDSKGARYSDKEIVALIRKASGAVYSEDEDVLAELYDMRKKIITKMEIISAYTERFSNYDYVVKRMDTLGFDKLQEKDDDTLAKELLSAVFASEDNAVINLNIETMLSQLPVRMTKSKFYDLISGALKSYIGTDKEYVDRYLYLLRSAAGIYEPAGMESSFVEFNEFDKEIKELLSGEISDASLDRMFEIIESATTELNVITDEYIELQVLINHLCIVLEMKKYVSDSAIEGLTGLIKDINAALDKGDAEPVSEDWLESFEQYEGILERAGFDIQKQKSRFEKELSKDSSADSGASDEEREYVRILDICEDLTSDSVFAAPETDEEKCMEQADEAYIDEVADSFIKELDAAFANDKKQLARARMAAVLGSLPVFFNSRTEVMNYILNVLANCRDKAEKQTSVRLALEAVIGEA